MPFARSSLILSLLAAAALQGQQQSVGTPGSPIPTIKTTARLVVLDVVVTDGLDHPVKGLKPSDLTLSEDGIPQKLASFTEHDATVAPMPSSPANSTVSPAALRPNSFAVQPPVAGNGAVTVIVLGNLSFADAPYVRYELQEYLKSSSPTTPMAIFRLDWQGLHLVQGFTADRDALTEAAHSKRILPPLGFAPPGATFTRGSLQLKSYLARIPGRVNIIWFGSGIGKEQKFPDVTTFVHDIKGSASVLQLSRVALYFVNAGGLTNSPEFDLPFSFNPNPTFVNRAEANTLILPDASGPHLSGDPHLQPNSKPSESAVFSCTEMSGLDESLGGRSFCNTNGFKEVIANVEDTGSHYYTVSYSPANPNWNGAFRRIHIDLNVVAVAVDTRSLYEKILGFDSFGPKLLYRAGYYARDGINPSSLDPRQAHIPSIPDPSTGVPGLERRVATSDQEASQVPMEAEVAFGAATPTDIHFTVTVNPLPEVLRTKGGDALPAENFLTPPFRSGPYRTLRIHYWVDPRDLLFMRTEAGTHSSSLQFVAILYRDDGLQANSIAYTAPLDLNDAGFDRIGRAGLGFDQTIALPTNGNFFLRAAVREVPTGRTGALEIPAEWIKLPLPQPLTASAH